MNLQLHRIAARPTYTIGRLYIENQHFCDTLEPAVNPTSHKLPKAIPAGRYPVVVTWSPRFQRWLPLLLHVRFREGIRIHAGNTAADTRGCILVGRNQQVGKVLSSAATLERLMQRLRSRPEGEGIFLTVTA